MVTRSITPVKSFSSPMGSWMGTTFLPNFFCRASSVRVKEARSRSILLTMIRRGRRNSSANFHTFSVVTSTPVTPLTTIAAESATRMAVLASIRKMPKPGVSSRLILQSFHSAYAIAAEIECLRSISSGSKSVTVVPSSMRPMRVVAPEVKSSCETSVVLPVSLWPASTTFRMSEPA